MKVFEVDQPGLRHGSGSPDRTRLRHPRVAAARSVRFRGGRGSWWEGVKTAGFDDGQPAVVASAGVSMYLLKDAIAATLRQVAVLAPSSTLAMTFMLPIEFAAPEERPGREAAEKGARAGGTPFISLFTPQEMLALARDAGFREARHVSAASLTQRYFAGRTDGLRPSSSEELLVAATRQASYVPIKP